MHSAGIQAFFLQLLTIGLSGHLAFAQPIHVEDPKALQRAAEQAKELNPISALHLRAKVIAAIAMELQLKKSLFLQRFFGSSEGLADSPDASKAKYTVEVGAGSILAEILGGYLIYKSFDFATYQMYSRDLKNYYTDLVRYRDEHITARKNLLRLIKTNPVNPKILESAGRRLAETNATLESWNATEAPNYKWLSRNGLTKVGRVAGFTLGGLTLAIDVSGMAFEIVLAGQKPVQDSISALKQYIQVSQAVLAAYDGQK